MDYFTLSDFKEKQCKAVSEMIEFYKDECPDMDIDILVHCIRSFEKACDIMYDKLKNDH